jgi:hypothetical protein
VFEDIADTTVLVMANGANTGGEDTQKTRSGIEKTARQGVVNSIPELLSRRCVRR